MESTEVTDNYDEKILVSQLRNNDVKSFDILFEKYSTKLYRFSFSLLKNHEDSREIVQETFFRVWDKRHEIDSSKSFKSFLFTISYHLIIDQLRLKLKDQEYRSFLKEYFKTEEVKVNSEADYETLNRQISTIIEKLPVKRKQIFTLSREKGLNHKEIAEQLNISVKTVENQINLALRLIKSRLGTDIFPVLLFLSLFS
jgi:RNA polymerase sigma-70 factor (ECF subfamily)